MLKTFANLQIYDGNCNGNFFFSFLLTHGTYIHQLNQFLVHYPSLYRDAVTAPPIAIAQGKMFPPLFIFIFIFLGFYPKHLDTCSF